MNVGVLGGTFNPIHNGHLHIAREACKEIPLDRLVWIPTAVPPFKSEEKLADIQLRCQMVQLAIQGETDWEISDLELDTANPSHTIDSLEQISKRFSPPHKLYLIIGADNLTQFPRWKEAVRILKLAEVVAMTRIGYSLRFAQGPMRLIPIQPMNVSSAKIRKLLQSGQPITGLVPEPVERVIREKGLYRGDS